MKPCMHKAAILADRQTIKVSWLDKTSHSSAMRASNVQFKCQCNVKKGYRCLHFALQEQGHEKIDLLQVMRRLHSGRAGQAWPSDWPSSH